MSRDVPFEWVLAEAAYKFMNDDRPAWEAVPKLEEEIDRLMKIEVESSLPPARTAFG